MSLRFCDSFNNYSDNDLYLTNKWSTITGSQYYINATGLNISLGTGRFGNNSLRLITNSNTWYISKTLDSQATWIIGFALKISNISNYGINLGICSLYDSITPQVTLGFNGDMTLFITRANNTRLTNSLNSSDRSSKPLTVNAWNYIELQITISSSISSNSCKAIVNGETWINLTSGQSTKNSANSTANQIYLGAVFASFGGTVDYSDLYICDGTGSINNSPLGDVRVESRLPKAVGSNTSWSSNGNSALGCINEQYPDYDSNFLSSVTTNDISTFTIPSLLTTPGTIFGIQTSHVSRKTDSSVRQIADVIRSGSTNYPGTTVNLGISYAPYLNIFENDPNTSSPWTTSAANAMEIGVKEIT